jgi:uncharacterized phage protein (TIGR01671 family)
MRDIKFRLWDNRYNEYTKECYLYASIDIDGTLNHKSYITVEQFTGLYDKNNSPIFEGDIVMANITIEVKDGDDFDYFSTDENGRKKMSCSLKPGIVKYGDEGYFLEHKSGKTEPFWICAKDIKEKYYIIGNIHQNAD